MNSQCQMLILYCETGLMRLMSSGWIRATMTCTNAFPGTDGSEIGDN